jgi:energy-coupling factor transporter transmembrane protein EcfT
MNNHVFSWFIIYLLLCILLVITAHFGYCRLYGKNASSSPQNSLLAMILVGNIPLLFGTVMIGAIQYVSLLALVLLFIYALIVYNCMLYAYFHFFNMSETARRIRILLQLRESGCLTKQQLIAFYSPENMVEARLQRLQKMGVICRTQEGNYRTCNNIAVMIARLFQIIRKLLGF